MTATTAAIDEAVPAEARRNVITLAVAAAAGGSLPAIAVTLGGLTGMYLLGPDKSLATLPVSGFNLGVALGAYPAALLMRHVGRRLGFLGGSVIAMAGGLVSCAAVFLQSFALFFVGFALVGISGAFTQQYRFAAADTGNEAFRARAISWVLAAGIAAAIIGPQTVILTRDLFAPIPFAGAYLAMTGLAICVFVILLFLTGSARGAPRVSVSGSGGRPLAVIARQPRFIVAAICAMGSYALMSLVMTAAPLAMVACGLGEDNAALGIQWHILAMYVPSFFTGRLIARFGTEPVIAAGMALLTACGIVGLGGIDLGHFWIALILLGLGWNLGFIGATAMLTQTYTSEERGRVQGLNDSLVFGTVAVASFASGKLFGTVGWEWINYVVFPVVAICLLSLGFAAIVRRRFAA